MNGETVTTTSEKSTIEIMISGRGFVRLYSIPKEDAPLVIRALQDHTGHG